PRAREPSSSFFWPNCVVLAMLVIVERALLISDWLAARAAVSLTPRLAESSARPRTLPSRRLISLRAPSAVCTTETRLFVLSRAARRPVICARCCSEITNPAGPSAPRLIFRPLDSRSNDFDRELEVMLRFFWAVSDATLFTIDRAIISPLFSSLPRQRG